MPPPILFVAAIAIAAVLFWYSRSAAAAIDLGAGSSSVPLPTEISSSWTPPARAQPYLAAIAEAELRYGLPHNLLARQLYEESRYRADIINGITVSSAGAIGIAQFLPATAADYGVDPLDPFASIDGAARYDRDLFDRFGNWEAVLAAYNWGPTKVANLGIQAAPAATVAYYSGILGDLGIA